MKHNLKNSFFVLFFSLSTHSLYAQSKSHGIALNYDDNNAGRNINVILKKQLNKKNVGYLGLKYNLNSPNFRNDYNVYTSYFKEFRANDISQRFGIKAGIEREIYKKQNKFSLFVLGDVQFISAESLHGLVHDIFKDTAARNDIGYVPMRALESAFGIGTKINLTQNVLFRLQCGIGFNYYWSPYISADALALSGNRRMPLPLNRLISAGIEYNIQKQKPQKNLYLQKEAAKNFLSLSYNNVQIGRNYSASYYHLVAANTYLYGGLKFNMNSKAFVDYTRTNESYYFKQMEATSLMQHFGLKMGIEHHLPVSNANFEWLLFYNFDLSNSDIRNLAHVYNFHAGVTRNSLKRRTGDESHFGAVYRICKNVTSLENTVGIGARMGLSEKINFRVQAGLGINYYIRPDFYEPYTIDYIGQTVEYKNVKFDAPKTELSKMFSLGFEYKL